MKSFVYRCQISIDSVVSIVSLIDSGFFSFIVNIFQEIIFQGFMGFRLLSECDLNVILFINI